MISLKKSEFLRFFILKKVDFCEYKLRGMLKAYSFIGWKEVLTLEKLEGENVSIRT